MVWFILLGLGGMLCAVLVLLARAQHEADAAVAEKQKLAQDRERLIEFMHLMTEALGEGLSREELHQRIVHASILCTEALSACIFEKTERNTMRSVAVEGLFPPHRAIDETTRMALRTRASFIEQVLKSEEFPLSEGVVGRVARTGKGELLADAASDPRMVKHDDAALAVRSVIVVPLVFRSRFFGVLAVANPAGDQLFTMADFTLMQSLAEQAALALHNSAFLNLQIEKKQLDLDLEVASGIQQMLLPRAMPQMRGLDIDARYRAAQRVGGDLYDFVPLSGSRLGIVVADVSGKGIPASLLMAMCRTNFRQIAPRHGSPMPALVELSRSLAEDIPPGFYITILYAIVDGAAGLVTVARAGHELPLFVRRNRQEGVARAEYVRSEGMALGMVPQDIFAEALEEEVVSFAPGDVLVLYTDGLTEAPNEEGKEFSGARMGDIARAHVQESAKEINGRILEAITRFSGETPQRDDFTLVTVKRV
ncbi:MAG: GAF domain-containing SpoIIE family protein phosphatase [Verrucomicrobiota bacterium]